MAFCPFYNLTCPKDFSCAVWTHFGCCMVDKPGTPAIYTDPPNDPVDVYILQIFCGNPKTGAEMRVVYALASDGTIDDESDLSKFAVHLLQ